MQPQVLTDRSPSTKPPQIYKRQSSPPSLPLFTVIHIHMYAACLASAVFRVVDSVNHCVSIFKSHSISKCSPADEC